MKRFIWLLLPLTLVVAGCAHPYYRHDDRGGYRGREHAEYHHRHGDHDYNRRRDDRGWHDRDDRHYGYDHH